MVTNDHLVPSIRKVILTLEMYLAFFYVFFQFKIPRDCDQKGVSKGTYWVYSQ